MKNKKEDKIAIANELSEKDKLKLSKMFPNLKKYKKKQERENRITKYRLRIVDTVRQEFLEKLPQRLEGYLKQINQQLKTIESNEENINSLSSKVDKIVEKLEEKEYQRRKSAGKVGGLTASLNKEKEKTEKLLKNQSQLENVIKDLEVKLEESMSDKYLVRKIPSGRMPKPQTMKIKNCSVPSNIAKNMFERNK